MTGFSFRALTGGQQYYLPDVQDVKAGFQFGDIPGFDLTYPDAGVNAAQLAIDTIVIGFYNGVELYDGRWHIQARSGEAYGDPPVTKWIGKPILDALRRVIVDGSADIRFDTANAGGILNNLFTAAQARGAMTGFTWTFTNTVDSSGAAWSRVISIGYRLGTKYLDILRNLFNQGMIEFRLNGMEIQVFNVDGMGSDLSLNNANQVELVAGRDYEDMPYRETAEERAKYALVMGDDGVVVSRTSAAATGPFGREEISLGNGGTKDVGTLNLIGDNALGEVLTSRKEFTREVRVLDASKQPSKDYRVGDYILDRVGTAAARYRVRTIVLKVDSKAAATASITLNDQLMEADIRNARRIDGILGGSNVEGGGNSVPVDTRPDTTTPNAPTGLVLTSATYLETGGRVRALISANWNAPTLNTDNSSISDLQDYEISYMKTGDASWQIAYSTAPQWVRSDLEPGTEYQVKVRARDSNSHISASTAVSLITLNSDTTPPSVPSTPTASATRGVIIVGWDGLTSTGSAMEADFDHVEVHRSTTSAFTPSSSTLYVYLFAKGTATIPGQAYGTAYYYKLVAVDRSGNKSAGSAQATATATALVSGDLAQDSIDSIRLAPDAVVEENVLIGSLGVSRLAIGDTSNMAEINETLAPSVIDTAGGATHQIETISNVRWSKRSVNTSAEFYLRNKKGPIPFKAGSRLRVRVTAFSDVATNAGVYLHTFLADGTYITSQQLGSTFSIGTAEAEFIVEGDVLGATMVNAAQYIIGLAGMTTGRNVRVRNVRAYQMNAGELLVDGSIRTPLLAANAVEADKVAAGAIQTEHLALGVLRKNLIGNPGFEDDYTFPVWDLYGAGGPGDPALWRSVSGSPYRTTGDARSGSKALHLDADATAVGAPVEASVLSPSFPITAGKKYKVVVHGCAVVSPAKLSVQLYTGTTPTNPETFNSPAIVGLGDWSGTTIPVISGSTVTADSYKPYSMEFTADVTEWAALRVMNYQPASLSGLVVDDISVIEMGIGGAAEVTSAGVRLFDDSGEEVGAFVSNRPNFFTVTRNGTPLASISSVGAAKFTSLNADTDPTVAGFPLMGGLLAYQSPMTEGGKVSGHLDKVGRGVVAFGNLPNNPFTGTTYQRELSFLAEPGRSYKVTYGGGQVQLSLANTSMGVYFGFSTPATDGGDATGQGTTTYRHNYTSVDVANQQVGLPAMSFLLRCNKNGLASGGEIRAGRNRLKIGVNAGAGTLTVNQLHDFFIEDVGPDVPDTDVTNTASTAIAAATQTWTSKWYCDSSEAYDGSGVARTDTTDLVQGYYSSAKGNHFSHMLFGGTAFSGEAVSVSTAMTGAAVVRARLFLYFKKWYYPDGGTAYIYPSSATVLTSTVPGGVSTQQAMSTQSGGMWIDITPYWDTAKRSVTLGRSPFNTLQGFALAASHADAVEFRPVLELTYRK